MPEFKLLRNGLQDQFLRSRTKIQIYGGGFGNGKTTAATVKAVQIASDYPGSNGLLARATYPKLNDTLRKEFLKWMPQRLIKSFPMSANASNTCTLHNGSMINFRYIAQQGKNEEQGTSNLLSANYDYVLVDQVEDPEITYKDFLDLLGRLRGQTVYRGEDETMPRTGPRWLMLTANPTRNWLYKRIVAPLHEYQKSGRITDDLLCVRDTETNLPVIDALGKPRLLVSLVEGGTDANAHNLPEDFIQSLASTYRGQMRDRFLKGEWASYEGLVYPQFNETLHLVESGECHKLLRYMRENSYEIRFLEAYDHGLASPSCYLFGFIDPAGNVIVCDGFYLAEVDLADQANRIKVIRTIWGCGGTYVNADPAILKRAGGRGERTGDILWKEYGIKCVKADNDIENGIQKVSSYLNPRAGNYNPFTNDTPAPSIFFNEELDFIATEIGSYYWRKDKSGETIDKPVDGNDHSLDTIKYMLTTLPIASQLKPSAKKKFSFPTSWVEDEADDFRSRIYG